MNIRYGEGKTEFGPGVMIELEGDDVATAIDAWLVGQGVHVRGSRTITVNGYLIDYGKVYVDPSGFVVNNGVRLNGWGPKK